MRRRHLLTGKTGAAALAAVMGIFMSLSGQAFAQGFDWSQLLGGGGGGGAGGGGGGQRHQHSGQSGGSGVTVDRGSPPYTGKFVGKQEDQGIENTMTAELACYPATDSDIPQSKAFVCYTPGTNGNNSSGGGSSYGPPGGGGSYGHSGDGGSYGPSGGGSPYGPPAGGPPNGPPPGIE